jgi:FAD/FMN-containing dehydrogenase
LYPQPRSISTAWVAVADPARAVALCNAARSALGADLLAFELVSQTALAMALEHLPGTKTPLATPAPWHILLETASGASPDGDARMTDFLGQALESSLVQDGVVAASSAQRDALWRLRHGISEAQKHEGASIKHDIAVPISRIPELLHRGTALATRLCPGVRVVAFGHLGDGNIHFNLSQPQGADPGEFLARWDEITGVIHALAVELGGTFSAEHGIGSLKVGELRRWRGGVELELMRQIKNTLDPRGNMNPGKLL